MKILMIDNYDSFTFNLVQYLGELGADITVWRNNQFDLEDVASLAPQGVVVSPGPCTPYEAGHSIAVIQQYGQSIPTLGVCLGHQSIGAAFGATVTRASRIMHGKTSVINNDGTGVFANLSPELETTRYHSLIVKDLPEQLIMNAWVEDDGELVNMAMRHRDYPIWGVQFHPESILTQSGHAMLKNFLALCA